MNDSHNLNDFFQQNIHWIAWTYKDNIKCKILVIYIYVDIKIITSIYIEETLAPIQAVS